MCINIIILLYYDEVSLRTWEKSGQDSSRLEPQRRRSRLSEIIWRITLSHLFRKWKKDKITTTLCVSTCFWGDLSFGCLREWVWVIETPRKKFALPEKMPILLSFVIYKIVHRHRDIIYLYKIVHKYIRLCTSI